MAGVSRAGLDIALIVLAVLACWQLRQFSAVGAGGSGGIDPVLALAPALALAAGSVVVLRLLPIAAAAADWLAARGRGLLAALASWQFSRMPVRQGSSALLLVMAVAAGTLALAQHQSWTRSAADQASFTAGADVQVDLPRRSPPARRAPWPAQRRQPLDGGRVRPDRGYRPARRGRLGPGGRRRPAARRRDAAAARSPVRRHHAVRPVAGGGLRPPSPVRARAPSGSRSPSARPRARPQAALAPSSGRSP